jgi:hypothetical protein
MWTSIPEQIVIAAAGQVADAAAHTLRRKGISRA